MNDCNCGAQNKAQHDPHKNDCAVYSNIGKKARIKKSTIQPEYPFPCENVVGTIVTQNWQGCRIEHESFDINDAAEGKRAWFFEHHEFEVIE